MRAWAKIAAAGAGTGLAAWAITRARQARAATRPVEVTIGPATDIQWGPDAEGYTWDYINTDYQVQLVSEPSGYRRLKGSEATPALQQQAKSILTDLSRQHGGANNIPFGTQVPFAIDATNYLALIEQHYHPPGGKLKPWGPHRGVSLFVQA